MIKPPTATNKKNSEKDHIHFRALVPDVNTILRLFGPWLFKSCLKTLHANISDNIAHCEGQAEALATTCYLIAAAQSRDPLLEQFSDHFLAILKGSLSDALLICPKNQVVRHTSLPSLMIAVTKLWGATISNSYPYIHGIPMPRVRNITLLLPDLLIAACILQGQYLANNWQDSASLMSANHYPALGTGYRLPQYSLTFGTFLPDHTTVDFRNSRLRQVVLRAVASIGLGLVAEESILSYRGKQVSELLQDIVNADNQKNFDELPSQFFPKRNATVG